MDQQLTKMHFRVSAQRQDAHASLARCKDAQIALDTCLAGRGDAFNPAELLLAALLHENVCKYGTVFNTVAPGTVLKGVLRRAARA